MKSSASAGEHGPGAAWFIDALTRRLELLGDDEFVVVWVDDPSARPGSGPYVLLARDGEELSVEVARNRFLADHGLEDDEQVRLVELGFHAPTASADNFWLARHRSENMLAATSASAALLEVFGISDARLIGYVAGPLEGRSSAPMATLSLAHHRAGLSIWAKYDDTGALLISGQDLGGGFLGASEYEYFITIGPSAFHPLREALGAPHDVDVRSLVTAYGPVLNRVGEKAWLDRHAIPYAFSNWVSP